MSETPKEAAAIGAPQSSSGTIIWPALALVLLLALQFSLIFTRSINWDEFYFWHEVAKFAEGDLARPLQTIHVRFFSWIAGTHTNSVDAISFARVFMFAAELVTLASLIMIGRHFSNLRIGVMLALLYVSAGYVLQHGTSFRVDPMVTACLMAALAILTTTRLSPLQITLFGLLAGLSGMITIKAVLYAPAFAGIAWMRWEESGFARQRIWALATCAAAALISFAFLYWLHSQGLPSDEEAMRQSTDTLVSSGGWVFFLGIPPYWQMALKSMFIAPFLYACIFAAPVMILRSKLARSHKCAWMGLWLPITCIFFYTNTAAYFYVFILAPVAAACILPLQWAEGRYGTKLTTIALVVMALGIWYKDDRQVIDRQRQLVSNVQEIFPAPVTYIDENYTLAAWPKGNGFMTPWGMQSYYENGRPIYRKSMEEQTIPLVLTNSEQLQAMLEDGAKGLLLPEDDAAIRNNYVEFSRAIWIAGKQFPGGTQSDAEEFLVPGPYTVSGGLLTIDGVEHPDSSVVEINRGVHSIANTSGEDVRMIWGENLKQPETPVEPGKLYVGF